MIRILLVDDQNLVQQGIKSLLDQDSDLKVIGTVKDGRSAIKQIDVLRPDIVLLDIEMPGMDGITATKYISRLSPDTKVIVLSSHEDKKYLTQALMAGAKAYILKSSLLKDLKQAILAVNCGYSHIESRLLAKIFAPNNLKLRGGKTEPETEQVNHQNHKRQSSSVDQTQNTPVNLQPQEINDAAPTAKQSLGSQDEVSQVAESNTFVAKQPDESTAKPNSITPTTTTVNSELVEQNDLVKSVEVEVEVDHNNNQFNRHTSSEEQEPKNSAVPNQFLPAVIAQHSSSKLASTPKGILAQLSILALRGKNHLQHIISVSKPHFLKYKTKVTQFYQLKVSQSEPIVRSLKIKLSQYKSRFSPIIKRWYEKGWLSNIGLILLGIITTIIVHQMFS